MAFLFLSSCDRPAIIPVQDFFKNPDSRNYQISPDGTMISCLRPTASRRLNIFVRRLSGGNEKCVTSETDRDISDYFWKGNGHLVYLFDRKGDWNFYLRCADLNGHVTPPLTPLGGCAVLLTDLEDSDDQILIQLVSPGQSVFDVYRLNVVDGGMEKILENPGNVRRWITDQQGSIRGEITMDGLDICLLTRNNDNEPFRTVLTTNFRHSIKAPSYAFGDDAAYLPPHMRGEEMFYSGIGNFRPIIYALSSIGRDKLTLVTIDPGTGKETTLLPEDSQYDVNGVEFSKKQGAVTCTTVATCQNERRFLDSNTEATYAALAKLLPHKDEVDITAHDQAEKKFIVLASSDRNPGQYYLFDQEKRKLTLLGEVAPQLKGRLARMECIEFQSRDNRIIHGYLTLPIASDHRRRPLPLVVIPHGGPWLRNYWGFNRENREVQFFANRGYAVLQVNFRGSFGYGSEFWQAGFKQWGNTMQYDVTDGVLWAIRQGIADKTRIAIVGESYGGSAALAGITFTHEKDFRYVAAVDRAGISNLLTLMNAIPNAELREKVGDPVQDGGLLADFSPELHADQINTPLLVAHGTNDPIVDPAQSEGIVCAVVHSGHARVEYLPVKDEGHIFENEESRIAYYEAVEAFLKKYLH